jgi:hypothetical protein
MDFVTTRVTNPSKRMARKRKKNPWSAAKKRAWSEAMARARKAKRAKRSKRSSNPRKRAGVTRRRTARRTTRRATARHYRTSNPTRRRRHYSRRRKSNPIDWKETAVQGLGVLTGSYLGWAITSFVGDNLIDRLPDTVRGIGYLGAGFGALVAGFAVRPHAPKLPVMAFTYAATVPMWLRAMGTFNLLPASAPAGLTSQTVQEPVAPTGEGTVAGYLRRLMPRRARGVFPQRYLTARGTMFPGESPGMRGTMFPGESPGMRGTILPNPSPGYRAERGGVGPVL